MSDDAITYKTELCLNSTAHNYVEQTFPDFGANIYRTEQWWRVTSVCTTCRWDERQRRAKWMEMGTFKMFSFTSICQSMKFVFEFKRCSWCLSPSKWVCSVLSMCDGRQCKHILNNCCWCLELKAAAQRKRDREWTRKTIDVWFRFFSSFFLFLSLDTMGPSIVFVWVWVAG